MILVVEGLDNTGKTTLIKDIRSKVLTSPKTISIHCSSPPKSSGDSWSMRHYTNILSTAYDLHIKGWDVILDRSHIGECVYGPLYRNVKDCSYIFDLEEEFLKDQNSLLILLTDDTDSLISRDDGFSPTINKDELNNITNLFIDTFNKSYIKNKLHYDISRDGGFTNLFPTVKRFIDAHN